jgi:UDP-3-O-[3-hydroxymyristoyl] N-acetylglucosamine deacetylase
MRAGKQTTLRTRADLTGNGVHSGISAALSINPAPAGTGIVFIRTLDDGTEREIRVAPHAVAATEFATVLGDASGALVSTVEHILASLYGLGVDNAIVDVTGPEVPILDGSAAQFVEAIERAGVVELKAPRRYLRILKPIGVTSGSSYGELRPYDRGFRLEVEIDFAHALVGRQSIALDMDAAVFRRELARARTFGFVRDVTRLWSAGYALGATFENTLVVAEERILNPGGLRYPDEFVRHKALDAMGDLALAGMPIIGAYRSIRGGHRLNHAVLCALLSDRSAWAVETQQPSRRLRGHAGFGIALAQPAFAPDVS